MCRDGRCTCPTNFEEYDLDDTKTICRLGDCVSVYFLLISRKRPVKSVILANGIANPHCCVAMANANVGAEVLSMASAQFVSFPKFIVQIKIK